MNCGPEKGQKNFTKYMANDDFSETPRRADSKNPIFISCRLLGLGHLRGPGVSLGRILGVPSIEPFLERGGGGLAIVSPPPPKLKARPQGPEGLGTARPLHAPRWVMILRMANLPGHWSQHGPDQQQSNMDQKGNTKRATWYGRHIKTTLTVRV